MYYPDLWYQSHVYVESRNEYENGQKLIFSEVCLCVCIHLVLCSVGCTVYRIGPEIEIPPAYPFHGSQTRQGGKA